jgi:predicted nucleic acid-binding protein
VILPGVNVLIYAFRKDAPEHAVCNPWLTGVVAGDARFGVSRLALGALVRVTTNPRVYAEPSTLAEAFTFCDYLLGNRIAMSLSPARNIGRSSDASAEKPIRRAHA